MSKATLLEKLTNKGFRDAFISEEIDVGLPMQLREMRESRGWKQGDVAKQIGTKQPRFSVMEKLGYGNFSLNTLKKLASVFDVALIVSFVPYSEMIEFIEAFSRKRLAIPGFADEYASLERRYAKGRQRFAGDPAQATLPFQTATTFAEDYIPTDGTPTPTEPSTESLTEADLLEIANQTLFMTAAGGSTDARL
jgi:transcriptional regulator with XRE-family HTH domain